MYADVKNTLAVPINRLHEIILARLTQYFRVHHKKLKQSERKNPNKKTKFQIRNDDNDFFFSLYIFYIRTEEARLIENQDGGNFD